MPKRFALRPHTLALLAYLALTLVMTWPLAANLTTVIPGDGFDGWQNYWNLWWVKVALVDRVAWPFTTDLLFYPQGVGLYFHTLNPFNGLVTLPVQLVAGLIPAYNAVVLISWMLGGYGVYLLTLWTIGKKVEDSRLSRATSVFSESAVERDVPKLNLQPSIFPLHASAFIAGLIFTFSPFHMAHLLGHMQVMALQWIPFYVLYLLRALDQQRHGRPWLRSALLAGLFLVLNGLCDWYFVLYLFLFTGLVILWHIVSRALSAPRSRPRFPVSLLHRSLAPLLPGAIAGLLFLLVLSPVLAPMVREATQFDFMVRPPTDLYALSATVADFVIPNRMHALFRPQSFGWVGNQVAPVSERTIAVGYVALILAALVLWSDRRTRWRRTALWAAVAVFFFLMALGPRVHPFSITEADVPSPNEAAALASWTPFAVLNELIPFMRISRSVSRYALMVQLAVAVLAGVGAYHLRFTIHDLRGRAGRSNSAVNRKSKIVNSLLLPLIAALILFEYWVAPFPMSPPDTPPIYGALAEAQRANQGRAVLNLPMNYDRPGYLLYQTVHQQPLTVAYISRDDPRTFTERAPLLQHLRHLGPDILDIDPVAVGPTVLANLDVGWIVLDRYKMPGGLERDYTESLANMLFAGQAPFFEDERVTVYDVQAVDDPAPYPLLGALNWGPLVERDDGTRVRAISDAPARIEVRHAPPNAALRVRYQMSVGELLLDVDGEVLRLPPAPNGDVATVALGSASSVTLRSTVGDPVWISSVVLQEIGQ